MEILTSFILAYFCFLVPAHAFVITVRRRRLDADRITELIFAGVGSRLVFLFVSFVFGLILPSTVEESFSYFLSFVSLLGAILLALIYVQVVIKSLIRQSEVISRFFLDALPSSQLGVDLEYRQQAISLKSLRAKKSKLLKDSLQLGSLEGVLKWLFADLWLVVIGSFLVSVARVSEYLNEEINLEIVQRVLYVFSNTALTLIFACIINALPLISFFSKSVFKQHSVGKSDFRQDIASTSVMAILCALLFVRGANTTEIISLGAISVGIVFSINYYLKTYLRNQRAEFLFIREKDEFACSLEKVDKFLTLELKLPKESYQILNKDLLSYLHDSGVNDLPNLICGIHIEFTDVASPEISNYRLYEKYDQQTKGLGVPVMEPRIYRILNLLDTRSILDGKNSLLLKQKTSLRELFNAISMKSISTQSSVGMLQKYFEFLHRAESIDGSCLSKLNVDTYVNLATLLNRLNLLGYRYIPVSTLNNVLEMVVAEIEELHIIHFVMTEVFKDSPSSFSGMDGEFRILSLQSSSDEIDLLRGAEKIIEIAKEVEERSLSPLLIRVDDIANSDCSKYAEIMAHRGLHVKFIDQKINLPVSFYPIGVL